MDENIIRKKVFQPFRDFLKTEQSSGIILLISAVFSMVATNFIWGEDYVHIWHTPVAFHIGEIINMKYPLEHWINDGLMVIFFLVVGLEIKRELVEGELSSFRKAILPVVAAIGGMIVPAALYTAFNLGGEYQHGWGIPMATDIAFALGIMALLGSRVPLSLKVFLTALAVIDDLGAILVIAIFYSQGVIMQNLLISLGIFAFLLILNRLKVSSLVPYLLGGVAMWYFMHESGVHATIAGVLLAFTIPIKSPYSDVEPLEDLEHTLHPFTSFIVMPVFALANTAILLGGDMGDIFMTDLNHGIMSGLIAGKVIGIFGFTFIAVKLGIATLPTNSTWGKIAGVGFLGGIGFTMSIFISNLAFKGEGLFQTEAKVSVLLSSLIAGILGYIILSRTRVPEKASEPEEEEDMNVKSQSQQ